MNIYLLNGPPGCGKDTAGAMLANMLEGCTLKFAESLKEATHRMLAGFVGNGIVPFDWDAYEDCKDAPNPDFFGVTPRQMYIAVSEKLLKPLLGHGFFGREMALRIGALWDAGSVVITDCGFQEEVDALRDALPDAKYHLVRLRRKGCDFSADSRGYIHNPGGTLAEIANDGSKADLRVMLADYLRLREAPQETTV